jgi:hypothetical protein
MALHRVILLNVALLVGGSIGVVSCKEEASPSGHMNSNRTGRPLEREDLPTLPFSTLKDATAFNAVVLEKIVDEVNGGSRIVVIVVLRRVDGTRLALTSREATKPQVEFVKQLQIGKQYSFPDDYSAWEKAH